MDGKILISPIGARKESNTIEFELKPSYYLNSRKVMHVPWTKSAEMCCASKYAGINGQESMNGHFGGKIKRIILCYVVKQILHH